MPLISQSEIPALIKIFADRNLLLRHACQLNDFRSYLKLGGVPARSLLEKSRLSYTGFETDDIDHQNKVWTKVFFNLADFGHWFSVGKGTVPNPYGPILLVFHPAVLDSAVDVSITLRSASAKGFNRKEEGICLKDVPKLFRQSKNGRHYVKFKRDLEKAFPQAEVSSPEMNCRFPKTIACFSQLAYVVIDPYEGLYDIVQQDLAANGFRQRPHKREGKTRSEEMYTSLRQAVTNGVRGLDELAKEGGLSPELYSWAENVARWDKGSFQFRRFAKYLEEGTLSPLDKSDNQ